MSTGPPPNSEIESRDWEVDVASFVRFLNAQPGWEASPRQARLMLDLLLHLASNGELNDRFDLVKWLAPIFCKNSRQQTEFPAVYRRWMKRFAEHIPDPETDVPPPPDPPKPVCFGPWLAVATVCLVLLTIGYFLRPPKDERVRIDVVNSGQGSGKQHAPLPPVDDVRNRPVENPAFEATHRLGSRMVVRKLSTIPAKKVSDLPLWILLALAVVPILLWKLYRWWVEQAALERIRTQDNIEEDRFRLPNDDVDFLPSLNMGATARGLRVKELVPSSRLDVNATIQRAMTNPVMYEPVCLAEVEREYLFLIDRTYLGDHQTELARTLRQHFADFGVGIDSYTFRSDPTYCTLEREHAEADFDNVRLNVLLDRHPEHRVVLFCTTEVFFDGLTGKLKPWIDLLADRENKVVLTPDPVREWGQREIITERRGYRVLPMTSEGMTLFRDAFADRRQEELEDWERQDSSHEEILESDRWLERGEPSQSACDRLMNELQRQLGEVGMLWLGAIAVYPQIHWGLTLRLGANLLSAEDFQRLLPRLSHLIWFRHAYMPDWLREQFIERLQRTDPQMEMQVRDLLMRMLRDFEEAEEDYELPLRVKLEQPTDVAAQLKSWFDSFRRIARKASLMQGKDAPFTSNPYRDIVFLKFVSRPRLGALSLKVPDSVLWMLYPKGLAVYGFRTSTLLLLAVMLVLLVHNTPGLFGRSQAVADFQFAPASGVAISQPETSNAIFQTALPDNLEAGAVRFDNALGIKLVWCPPGKFTMGSPPEEDGHEDDERQVDVTLTQGFWMGQTEVTQAQWMAVMGTEPWDGDGYVMTGSDYPATYIDWDMAGEFCRRLTELEQDAGRLPLSWHYHLPSEAQWEYACRAGTTTTYSFGNREEDLASYAWFDLFDSRERYAHPEAQKLPNDWGLFDMHGNLWEWCDDGYMSKLPGGSDPVVAHSVGSPRVIRGGCWHDGAGRLRSASRLHGPPGFRILYLGFRCMSSPNSAKSSEAGSGGSEGGGGARPEVPK
ncbi:MAG: formylglycine-generating enzyme family protein [Planctomycetaceae bacterium]